jgi:hypothetical protein
MSPHGFVLSSARWFAVKWWSCNERAAGFLARVSERTNEGYAEFVRLHPEYEPNAYASRLRVEVYGPSEVQERARHHLRGFWAALESRGLPQDYRIGYSTGVALVVNGAKPKPAKLPLPDRKGLKA